MSSDYYIALNDVLSNPKLFVLSSALRGDIKTICNYWFGYYNDSDAEKDHAVDLLQPQLLCEFGGYISEVDIFNQKITETKKYDSGYQIVTCKKQYVMHFCCAGRRREVLVQWLKDHGIPYDEAEV